VSPVVETILFLFGLVALGYLAGLSGYLKADVGDALTEFAIGVALPLLLFRTMAGADFHGSAPWALWTAYFAAAAVAWLAGHLVMTRIFGRDSQMGLVGGVATAYSNLVLPSLPAWPGVSPGLNCRPSRSGSSIPLPISPGRWRSLRWGSGSENSASRAISCRRRSCRC
jgi:malonate transporter and related proteins